MVTGCGGAVLEFEQSHELSYVQTRLEDKIAEYYQPQRDLQLEGHPVRMDFEAMVRAIVAKVKTTNIDET